jgi:hypothetical protein
LRCFLIRPFRPASSQRETGDGWPGDLPRITAAGRNRQNDQQSPRAM